jgi:amino acid permease
VEALFEENKNTLSEIAWAFTVYSVVPYVGILFIPFAIVCGFFAIFLSSKNPQLGGLKLSTNSLIASFIVLFVQILLWYLLYIIPQISQKL